MDQFLQDLRVAMRRLKTPPGLSAMAILTLALGIGANAAIFAAINAIVFRPLPAERPKELVSLNVVGQSSIPTLSYPNYQD
ncbi:hypothetical protein ABTL55_19205, partial [Acinetobacter baumannii]